MAADDCTAGCSGDGHTPRQPASVCGVCVCVCGVCVCVCVCVCGVGVCVECVEWCVCGVCGVWSGCGVCGVGGCYVNIIRSTCVHMTARANWFSWRYF